LERTISGMLLTLILMSMSTLAFGIQPVEANGTIYIRADGSIDPPTALISSSDNVTYTLTSNIYSEIVVLKDNILIDGADRTVRGVTGSEVGIFVNANNVTIKNVKIRMFEYGVYLSNALDTKIHENLITYTDKGIELSNSSYNSIYGNTISANSEYGINLVLSSNNIISENEVENNDVGVALTFSSENNALLQNNIEENTWGIYIYGGSSDNEISGNVAANNKLSIWVHYSSHNIISENNINANNLGILLSNSSRNTISGTSVTSNEGGIFLFNSSNNMISGNRITENDEGVWLSWSFHNEFRQNDLMNNTQQISISTSGCANFWDNGVEGNYWSDYTGADDNGDYIGDIPYVIDSANIDHYPLMTPRTIQEDTTPPIVSVLSPENKTYMIDNVMLIFTASESTTWIGYSLDGQGNITINENTTLSGLSWGLHSIIVYAMDTSENSGASEIICFTVGASQPAPFPIWVIALIVMSVVSVAALLLYLTKIKKPQTSHDELQNVVFVDVCLS